MSQKRSRLEVCSPRSVPQPPAEGELPGPLPAAGLSQRPPKQPSAGDSTPSLGAARPELRARVSRRAAGGPCVPPHVSGVTFPAPLYGLGLDIQNINALLDGAL